MTRKVEEIWEALKSSRSPSETLKKTAASTHPDQPPLKVKELPSGAPTAPSEDASTEQTRITQRDVNCLSDPDRTVRKKAILKIHSLVSKCSSVEDWSSEAQDLFHREESWRKLMAMLGDPSDVCREKALAVVNLYLTDAEVNASFMHQLVQALKQRMGIGSSAVSEPSEEFRKGLAEFTATALAPRAVQYTFVEDIVLLLVQFLGDAFHEAKKQACRGIVVLTSKCDSAHLASSYSKLLNGCVEGLRHSHSRVRAAALQALSAVVQVASVPADTVGTQLVPAMHGLAADRSPELRAECFRACQSWLLSEVEAHQVEFQTSSTTSFQCLLPVLLLGLTDETQEIAQETLSLVESLGEAYCDIRVTSSSTHQTAEDKKDEEASEAACRTAAANLPPPFNTRPSAQAREMMRCEVQNVLPSVLKDAHEWTTALRCTASRSLYSIAALAENSLTKHLDSIIPALCQAVGDDDEVVTMRIIHCVHVVGAFCKAQHWMPLILDYSASLKCQPNSTVNALATLAALEIAAAKAKQPLPQDLLKRASQWLCSEDMRHLQHTGLQRQMVMVASNLIDLAGPSAAHVAEPLFHCLMHLHGQQGLDAYTVQEIAAAQQKLATVCGASSAVELAANHSCSLLATMMQRSSEWTSSHPDITSFIAILSICPGETLAAVGEPLCLNLSQITRDVDRDPGLRITILRAVHSVLEDDTRAPAFCSRFGLQLTILVLLPPLIWRAGKPAAAVRFEALKALYSVLSKRLSGLDMSPLLCPEIQLVPLLVQSMDEDWYVDTRKVACCTMDAFIRLCGSQMSDELRRSIYPELNKRMDDSSNEVRVATAAAMSSFARHALPETYCDTNSGYLVASFIIHLDDTDTGVQEAVLYALREIMSKKPAVVRQEVNKVYENFRSKHLLDELRA